MLCKELGIFHISETNPNQVVPLLTFQTYSLNKLFKIQIFLHKHLFQHPPKYNKIYDKNVICLFLQYVCVKTAESEIFMDLCRKTAVQLENKIFIVKKSLKHFSPSNNSLVGLSKERYPCLC